MNLRLGNWSRLLAPSYGWCYRHREECGGSRACFPLCERCWAELATPAQRLAYYRQLWESWQASSGPDGAIRNDWPDIELAVRAGG